MSTNGDQQPGRNLDKTDALRRGDHIRAGWPRGLHHDGIYLGNDHVIHLVASPGMGKAGAIVQIGTLAAFAAGRPVTVRCYAGKHDPDAVIARAMSRLGEGDYNLIFNNCQHFARWCATGDQRSEQVDAATAATGSVVAPAVAASMGINVVGSVGLVSGVSGAGIMSGLSACGAKVGGGAIAGMMLLSAVAGLSGVAMTSWALRDDDDLPDVERTARTGGQVGAIAGASAASLGGVAAVSALGVSGLSAAGISSGLAAIGGTFGGGMAAGTMCVVAAPAIAAALLGYAIYRFTLRLSACRTSYSV